MVLGLLTALIAACRAVSANYDARSAVPSVDVAADRGPQIFNSIFDATRLYGSYMHQNGMSFFVATVPRGVLIHHGSSRNSTPTTLDWMAFEIEFSEYFSVPEKPFQIFDGTSTNDARTEQVIIGSGGHILPLEEEHHGWLHTYRTTRPLRFLYLDGMSGNKEDTGVLDSQDYILRATFSAEPTKTDSFKRPAPSDGPPTVPGEFERAQDICDLCDEWQLQGALRPHNPGIEVIKCNFTDGLVQVQSLQRKDPEPAQGFSSLSAVELDHRRVMSIDIPYNYEYGFRDAGSSRVLVDYSSMVSAYFFPVNLTNPVWDPHGRNLPRLINTKEEERLAIKSFLSRTFSNLPESDRPASLSSVSWRDITDLVVRRYAPSITSMANASEATEITDLIRDVEFLINVFLDYSVADPAVRNLEARERCSSFYLVTKEVETESDQLIYAALKATNNQICTAFFDLYDLLQSSETSFDVVSTTRRSMQQLIAYLDWSVFEDNWKNVT